MIKKLEVEDIAKIMHLDDNVTDFFPCEKGEWVQWLIQNVDNPRIFIIGNIEDNQIIGYFVALNNLMPPVFDYISVIYLWSLSHKITHTLIEAGKKWAIKNGVKRGLITVPNNHTKKYMASFDGHKIANVFEWSSKQCHL